MQQRSKEAVEAILAAARERFGADGYGATSIEAVAAGAGRTKGAVYHHFADKQELFTAVFRAEQSQLAQVVVRRSGGADPTDALARGLRSYLAEVARSPTAARITLVDAPTVLGWQEWRACDGGPFRAMLHGAVGAMAAAGDLAPGSDPAVVAELLLGAATEAALHVATAARPAAEARRHGTELERLVRRLAGR